MMPLFFCFKILQGSFSGFLCYFDLFYLQGVKSVE